MFLDVKWKLYIKRMPAQFLDVKCKLSKEKLSAQFHIHRPFWFQASWAGESWSYEPEKKNAFAGSRTRVYCLEGNYPNRWTTNAVMSIGDQ